MSLIKKNILLTFLFCILFQNQVLAQTATYNFNITVGSAAVVTDATIDSAAGLDPSLPQSIIVSPDVASADSTGAAAFRIRTNEATWTLSCVDNGSSFGSSMINLSDISATFTQMAASGATAGTFSGSLPGPTSITNVLGMTVATGSAMTSSSRGSPLGSNSANYVEFSSTTSVPQDFFYEGDPTPNIMSQYSFVAP